MEVRLQQMPPYLSTRQSEVIGLGEVEEFFLVLNGFFLWGGEDESSLGGISQVSEREKGTRT